MSLYLNVPYSEKDEAKALGARWNPRVKKWYTEGGQQDYGKFAKWIYGLRGDAIIATEYIHVIEGRQSCWKCGKPTKVIGLGIGEYVHLYEDDGKVYCELMEDYEDPGEEVHLAWVDQEEDIPPKLLRYLKKHYSVKTGFSRTLGRKCFANHCDCCGALQGNFFLFDEPDSPLVPGTEGEELVQRMGRLKILGIPIEDDLVLNWNMGWSSNDYAYLKYGKFEELVLSDDPENEYVSYEELYS